MPASISKQDFNELIYEAMRAGKNIPFKFSTGGVQWRAVFEHREARERRIALSRNNSEASSLQSPSSTTNESA